MSATERGKVVGQLPHMRAGAQARACVRTLPSIGVYPAIVRGLLVGDSSGNYIIFCIYNKKGLAMI